MIKGSHHSEETKQRMSDALKGRKHSEKTKRRIGDANRGRIHSEESRKNMSDARLGCIPWNKGMKGAQIPWNKGKKTGQVPWNKGMKGLQVPWNKGIPHTEATNKKIGDANRGEKSARYGKPAWNKGKKDVFSDEALVKMSKAHKGKKHSEETIDKFSGPNHHNWMGGIGKLPYAFDFNGELKELIKKRDGYICQFPECGTAVDLTVHHIDYDKMNSDPKNLLTLCRSHNIKVNFNREYWEIYFMGGVR